MSEVPEYHVAHGAIGHALCRPILEPIRVEPHSCHLPQWMMLHTKVKEGVERFSNVPLNVNLSCNRQD